MSGGEKEQLNSPLLSWYKGDISPGAMTPLELVMIQATPFCNIDCSYCYLPNRNDRTTLPLSLIDVLFTKLASSGLLGDTLGLSWHAGEPLILPANYYEAAFTQVKRVVDGRCRVTHCFQTNATRITQEHCDVIKRHAVQVGVSIDGPDYLHDRVRKTRSGHGTHAQTMRGIEMLRANGILFSAIAVLTKDSLECPNELFDYFDQLNVTEVGFNVEEIEGSNETTSLIGDQTAELYKAFLHQILKRYVATNGRLRIREFNQGFAMLGGGLMHQSRHSVEANPLSIISMSVEGQIFTFSPELLDIRRDGLKFDIGHINDIDFASLYSNPRFLKVAAPVREGVEMCRAECGYFDLCGGGAPANKLAENGSFASTETMFCRLRKQYLIDALETFVVDNIEATRQRRRLTAGSRRTPILSENHHAAAIRVNAKKGDIRLQGLATDPNRVMLLTGTRSLPEVNSRGQQYETGARIPRLPQRRLSLLEIAELCVPSSSSGALDFVCIVRTPGLTVKKLAAYIQAMMMKGSLERQEDSLQSLVNECGSELASLFSSKPEDVKILGINTNHPNLTTTTLNSDSGLYLGLHLDSWSRLAPEFRSEAPNRLCVNLGTQPRRLIFLNQNVASICRMLETSSIDTTRTDRIARAFLQYLPDYPLLSVEIRPGEGYIAPTENMIHDGSTADMTELDISLTLLGRFDRAPPEMLRA